MLDLTNRQDSMAAKAEAGCIAWQDIQELDRAILRAIAYRDLFHYPVTAPEIHRYLQGVRCPVSDVQQALDSSAGLEGRLDTDGEFYALAGRSALFNVRRQRGEASRQLWREAGVLARRLASLPFVKMVAVTGSLAADNAGDEADIDFMLVTEGGRLWTCRAAAKCLQLLDRYFGSGRLCVNYLLTDRALVLDDKSLYAAQELAQMVPLYGADTCKRLWRANAWAHALLPNAFENVARFDEDVAPAFPRLKRMLELVLGSTAGESLERWESRRKLRKYNETAFLLGRSTPFSPEATGHRKSVKRLIEDAFEDRLEAIREEAPRKRVLFAEAYHLFLDAERWRSKRAFPPVTALRSATLAREQGFSVRVHDSVLAASLHEWQMALSVLRPDVVVICNDLAERLAGAGCAAVRHTALMMSSAAATAGARVVVCGAAASQSPDAYRRNGAEFVLSGDDHAGLCSVLNELGGNEPALRIAERPAPAWDLIDLERYAEIWRRQHGQATIGTVTARTEVGEGLRRIGQDRCDYVVARRVEDVVNELLELENYGFEFVWFLDEPFGIETGWVQCLADRLQKSGSRLRFAARMRAEQLTRPGEIEALAHAGCAIVWIGVDDDVRGVRKMLREFDVQLGLQVCIGGADGLAADVRAALSAIRQAEPDGFDIALSRDGILHRGVRRILYVAWRLRQGPGRSLSQA